MLNYEKYKEELKQCKGLPTCYVCEKLLGIGCIEQGTCGEKQIKIFDFLFSEYKEPIKLTHDEFAILKSIDTEYKWIARDMNFCLYAYDKKPIKSNVEWNANYNYGNYTGLIVFKHLFKFIKWEDEEPYNIQEILNNCEVIDDE